jgi:flagellar hook-associated protein 3 FlgL
MTSISTLGQALDQMERLNSLQTSMATLEGQISSGTKGNTFQALGSGVNGALGSERARASFNNLNTYIDNATNADTQIGLMTNALGEIQAQGQNLQSGLNITPADGSTVDISSISNLATTVGGFVNNLINAQDSNGDYLFGGADSSTPPLTDNGTLDTYEQGQINGWMNGTVTTAQLIQSYSDPTQLNDSTIGYSSTLASGQAQNVSVRVDDNTEINYTVKGNDTALRTIVTAVSMIKNLCSSVQSISTSATDPTAKTAPGATAADQSSNFYSVLNNLTTMLSNGLSALDTDTQNLSQTQAQIDQVSTDQKTQQSVLSGTMNTIEDVDINEAAVKVTALQTQLQASYSVTAMISKLSLVNYLGT